ncbi:MAG: BirA family transcriptional regulator [Gaiellales bacterium]|nr:BirA family transcriptional regulator [Gaiellales bacterium]
MIDPPRTIELERCDSTQDELRLLARAGAPAFTVVRADVQDAGRGRRGRSWHTKPGAALLASVLLRPRRPASELAGLAIVGGVAAARVVRGLGVDARVRWPNDVVVAGRKLAGVLAELIEGPAILLGVGMNADAGLEDLPETDGLPPTSLRLEGARHATPPELAALLVRELRPLCERFDEGGFAAVREDAESLDALRGLELELVLAGGETARGIARGFADDGALVLDTPEGPREHRAGLVARVHGGSLRQSPA